MGAARRCGPLFFRRKRWHSKCTSWSRSPAPGAIAMPNPFDPAVRLGCSCGAHASQAAHDQSEEALNRNVIETAVMRALFPQDAVRRRFLGAVGAGTALSAISSLVPFGALEAMAQEKKPPEKKDLKIGFI